MIVRPGFDPLWEGFIESVKGVTDSIVEMSEWVDENDSDPERTKAHKLDKILRQWFGNGGGLGYN